MNEARNDRGSVTVGLPNLNLAQMRRDLSAMRARHGSGTPIGNHCSNLIGQIENYEHVMGAERRKNLDRLIMKSMAELTELTEVRT